MRKDLAEKARVLLIDTGEFPSLGPERRPGVTSAAGLGEGLDEIFGRASVDPAERDLIRAIVLLWHDHLDESHSLSQNVHSADGSFIHAIMHRREPDYGNAKYWFQRVGPHPVLQALSLGKPAPWDPFVFVDMVAAVRRQNNPAAEEPLRALQAAEITALLDHVLAR